MRTMFKIIKTYAQVLLVLLAFALMVFISYYIVKTEIVQPALKRDAEATLDYAQAGLLGEVQEHEITLANATETVRLMIMSGLYSTDSIKRYVTHLLPSIVDVHGIFGEKEFSESPWFKAALGNNGEPVTLEPHYDSLQGTIITYARCLYDDHGKRLAVIGVLVKLDDKRIANMQSEHGGFGFLLNKDYEIIAHENRDYLGEKLQEQEMPLTPLKKGLMQGAEFFEHELLNYKEEPSIIFIRRIPNGWFLGVATPKEEYYGSVAKMAKILIGVGSMLALALSIVLIYIIRAKTKADAEAHKMRHLAETANKAKSAFLAKTSHEIRTPMNAILGVTEIQLQDTTLAAGMREAFTMIYNSSNLLLGIINNILDLSKIEAGKMELSFAKYDVASFLSDTVQLNIMRNSRKIEFELQVDKDIPMELIGDEIRVKQILNNLLSNAFKYTEKGKVKFSITYEDGPGKDQVTLIFQVSDTGQGMTDEQKSKLFDSEYIRFNLEANRTVEGTGLGMNIVQHLVQMMNGSISVESRLGVGTTFHLRLPQLNCGTGNIGKERADNLMQLRVIDIVKLRGAQFMREYMPYGKVLIVDDVESNLFVARGLMMPYGLTIDIVSSGFEAIDKVKDGNIYDVIFMDHMMPKMDGIETTKIIRGLGYTHPIVALTANALIGQAKIFLDNGFDEFISKPIDIRQLNSVLNKLIRDKQTSEVIDQARKSVPPKPSIQIAIAADTDLLFVFARDAQKAMQVFEYTLENMANITADDLHTYALTAHAMKSALANIGESTLSQMALELEFAGKKQEKDLIKQKTQSLIDALKMIIKRADAERDKKTTVTKNENTDILKEQLEKICCACQDYDIKTANAAIEKLKKTAWTKETEDLLDKISEHLLHSDFEEALSLLKKGE